MTDPARPDELPPVRPTRKAPETGSSNRGVFGVLFVVALVVLAVYLLDRMTYYASLGDCAFTHAPQCRALIKN